MLPTAGLLLVFLTYPLGLGLWLSMTDATIGQPGQFIGLENFVSLLEDPIFWMSVTNTIFYTVVATVGKFAARAVAGDAAQPPHPVQGLHPRDRAAAVDRADSAVGDRLVVDLLAAVLDHLLSCS